VVARSRVEYEHGRVPVADLVPYARNSRTHSAEQVGQLAAAIRKFGFTNPVLVDERNELIAGHGRIMAASEIGLDVVPFIRLVGLSDDERRAYVIADNKLALNAGWDDAMLADELKSLAGAGFDMGLLGFTATELSGLLKAGGLTDPDAAPPAPVTPRSKLGDSRSHPLAGFHRQAGHARSHRRAFLKLM
jgi:ParB-like chromosome segregation protein Spo0J